MKELIKTKEGQNVVNARDLHGKLNSKQEFSTWIKNRINDYGFVKDEDYFIDNQVFDKFIKNELPKKQRFSNWNAGRPGIDYLLTLDMAKELCMVERNAIGREIRRYFIEIEKKYQTDSIAIPATLRVYGIECFPYEYWLLKNNYSIMSSRVRERIRNRPDYFYKHSSGKWYICKEYATALLSYRNTHKMLAQCTIIPKVEQTDLFDTCEVVVFKRKE